MPRQTHPRLDARIRVERRRELIATNEELNWDEGDPLEFDDGADALWDDQIAGDQAGNFEGDWTGIGPAALRADVSEAFQGSDEAMIAGKLRGVAKCTVTLRASTFTRQITTDDRFVVLGGNGARRILNVRHAPPPGRERFIVFTCEAGVTT